MLLDEIMTETISYTVSGEAETPVHSYLYTDLNQPEYVKIGVETYNVPVMKEVFDTAETDCWYWEATTGLAHIKTKGDPVSVLISWATGSTPGWPSVPGIPSIPDSPSIPTGGEGAVTPVSTYLNLGIFLIVGAVFFALFWKEFSERDQSALKKFKSRREGKTRTSKDKEKQVPKALKKRRK